jgi:hypothetical protein
MGMTYVPMAEARAQMEVNVFGAAGPGPAHRPG